MKAAAALLSSNPRLDRVDGGCVRRLDEALDALEHMQQHGVPLWRDILYLTMQACNHTSAAQRLHSLMVASRLDSLAALGDPLIRLFGSCHSLLEANIVFSKIEQPSGFTWHAIISAHVMLGEHCRALELYHQMQQQHGLEPGKHTFSCILKSCGAIGVSCKGMLVHNEVIRSGLDSDVVVGSSIIDMYVKCGCLHEARKVFNNLPNRNEVTWNAMITGYAQLDHGLSALQLFEKMQQEGIQPGKVTFLCMLKACHSKPRALLWGRELHSLILRGGFGSDIAIGSALVDMYATCGSLEEALVVFVGMPSKNAVAWGAMISGYTQHGHGHLAVQVFEKMQQSGLKPDEVLFSCVLKGFAHIGAIKQGMLSHGQIIMYGLDSDVVLGSTLIDMYAKCGSLDSAYRVFGILPYQNAVTWSSMIAGYAYHGHGSAALHLFEEMQQQGIKPDRVTFVSILQACSTVAATSTVNGKLLHGEIVKMGLESDVVMKSNLVDMYAKCGSLEDALKVFDGLPYQQPDAWAEKISAYAQVGNDQLVLELFERMQGEGMKVEKDTLVFVLKSCGSVGAISKGKMIHEQIIKGKLEFDVVLGNTLLDMYVKCGALEEAHEVFNDMPIRDVVSWGIMIAGYGHYGHCQHALLLFKKMQEEGLEPDSVAFSCALKACCSIGSIEQVKIMHDWSLKSGLRLDLVAGNILVDLYAKCGSLQDARKVFDALPDRNEVSWNSIIAGYADHGMYRLAGKCLFDMEGHGLKPTAATYSSIFTACSHAGQVEAGWRYFKSMTQDHHIAPTVEHFNCMVDILGRAGYVDEAEELLQITPILPDAAGWTSLLTACKIHSNIKVGWQCYKNFVLLDGNSCIR